MNENRSKLEILDGEVKEKLNQNKHFEMHIKLLLIAKSNWKSICCLDDTTLTKINIL